jgi:hypothetical protein
MYSLITFTFNKGDGMKNIITLLTCICAFFLFGCGGRMYIDITQKAPIAVVGFSLNKSISEEGKEKNGGPGLLQQAVDFYKNHQIAVDTLWANFKTGYKDMFLGSEIIDLESIPANEKYREMTKHTPKMMLGMDVAQGGDVLTATNGLNYVSPTDKAIMDNLAGLLNAKLLVCIDYTGSYAMNVGISIGSFGAGAAKMKLTAKITIYEPGKGIVLEESFKESSDESFPLIGGVLVSDNYAKGLSSAHKKLFPEIKNFLQKEQMKAKEQGQKTK